LATAPKARVRVVHTHVRRVVIDDGDGAIMVGPDSCGHAMAVEWA